MRREGRLRTWKWLVALSAALFLLLELGHPRRLAAASLEAFPGFIPTRVDHDGNVMIGSGTPGNRWEDGSWMQVPGNLVDVSADGMRFTATDGPNGYKHTLSGGSLTSLPLFEFFGGGRISPGGGTVVGAVRRTNVPDEILASVGDTGQAASWINSSTPTRYGPAAGTGCWWQSAAGLVTNAGIFGSTEYVTCAPPHIYFSGTLILTRWPGAVTIGDHRSPGRIVASDDGTVVVGPDSGVFVQGAGDFIPVPFASGCDLTVLSANASVGAGGRCLWTAAAGWRQIADVLHDGGVDVTQWTDFKANDLSGDGHVLVGTAKRDGVQVGYRAVLDGLPDCGLTTTIDVPDDVPVGTEFTVESQILANPGGTEATRQIDWTPLEIGPAELVEVVSGPTPPDVPSGFELAPGAALTRSYVLRALEPGMLTLSASASGACAGGEPVAAPGTSRTVELTLDALHVEVQLDPAVIDLENDDDGIPIVQDVVATVTITNTWDEPVDDVRLIDLRARPREVPPPLPLPLAVVGGPFAPAGPVPDAADLGTLAAGEQVVRTYDLLAQVQGVVDVTAFVSSVNPAGPGRVTVSGTKAIEIKDDVLFVLDTEIQNVDLRNGEPWVLGGNSWRIVGTMENRSKEETLLVQLTPELFGNAAYAQPIPDGTAAPDAQCAVGLLRELAPEETIAFRAPVRTLTTGGTRGTVTYRPKVWIKGEGNATTLIHDERSAPGLVDERVVVTDGSGQHTVRVDTSDELPRQPFADEVIGHFLVGTVEGLEVFAEGIWSLVEMAGQAIGAIGAPWTWPKKLVLSAEHMTDYVVTGFTYLDDRDRAQLRQEMRAGLEQAIQGTGAVYDQIIDGFNQEVENLTVAWETGDSATVARFWGELAGKNPDLAIGFAYGVCKLGAKGARYAGRGIQGFKASQAATLEARIAAGVRALKPWDDLSRAQLADLFGIDDLSHAAFKKFSARGFVLAVRRRGRGSIAKLLSGNFVTKPYHLKAKNVGDIDVDWLGFPGDRLDEVLIKEPPPWSEVRARMISLDQEPDLIEEVRLRWKTRAEEWWGKGVDDDGRGGDFFNSERAQWLRHQENGIPYNKASIEGLKDNFAKGFVPDEDLEQVLKQFETESLTGTDGRGVLAAKIEGKYVTGDIDPMYVGRPDGRGFADLTDAERLEVYRLFRELGLQHPESRTWRNKKVAAYFEEFSIHNPNREAMAMYLPDGRVVASFFDWRKSWQNPLDWKHAYAFFRGGTTMLQSDKPDVTGLAVSLQEEIRLAAQPRAVYVGPGTWALVSPGCPGGGTVQALAAGGLCPCIATFTTAPDALVLRQSGIGTFERWTVQTGWVPYLPPEPAVSITPQTYLAAQAPAGTTEFQIGDLAALGLDPAAHAWFQVGQTIVINPGGWNEETATIAGFGSLILAAPLQFAHEQRETIAVVGPAQTASPDDRLLSGTLLLVTQEPGKPETRRARVVSKDKRALVLGTDAAGLAAAGGTLRIRSTGDRDVEVVYPLPAAAWKPLATKKPAKGHVFRGAGGVEKLTLRSGKLLDVTLRGADVPIDLESMPGTVQIELTLRDRRFCLEFAGRERFKAGRRLLRRKAPRAVACPPP